MSVLAADLRDLGQYVETSPIGSFFDDESSGGLFTRLSAHYPDYPAFIAPYAVRANGGRVLYPTAETRRFLERLGEAGVVRAVPRTAPPPAEPERVETAARPAPAGEPSPVVQPTPTLRVPTASCAQPIRLESIELTQDGLLVRANGPVAARITNAQSVSEAAFGSLVTVVVEIPFAEIGTAAGRVTSESGPFSSLRAVRYQTENDCGVRIRLDARESIDWQVRSAENAVVIGPPVLDAVAVSARRSEVDARPGGAIRVGGTFFGSGGTGATPTQAAQVQIGFATEVMSFGTLRGFYSQGIPQSIAGRYAAVALSGIGIGPVQSELAAGDLTIPVGGNASSSINSLVIRGGAASLFPAAGYAVVGFAGRAASPLLARVFDTRQFRTLSHDRLAGLSVNRRADRTHFGLAAAWIRGMPQGGGRLTNYLAAAETPGRLPVNVRLVGESSTTHADGEDLSGYAATIEPRASTARFTIGGYYRYTTPHFRAPLSSVFFASLRHAYTLSATYVPTDRLSVNASLAQSKIFSLFDPPAAGTLTTSESIAASYALRRSFGLTASYLQSTSKSDPGVILQTDNRSKAAGAGFFALHDPFTYGLHLSESRTRDASATDRDFESHRADADASYAPREELQWFGRGYYGSTKQSNGASAGDDYGLSVGAHSNTRGGAVRGEAGYAATPLGVAAQKAERLFATLAYTPPSSVRAFDGNVQMTLQTIRIADLPSRTVVSLSVNMGRYFEWGGEPRPFAPYETRALPVGQAPSSVLPAWLRIYAFEDRNGNGLADADEPAVSGVNLKIGARTVTTADDGRATLTLASGRQEVTVDPSLATMGYALTRVPPSLMNLSAGHRRDLDLPLIPSGRISGHFVFQGEGIDASAIEGVRVTATAAQATREVIIIAADFQFGLVPAGEYDVAIDPATFPPELRVVGEPVSHVVIHRGSRAFVTFTVRRATARERMGVPSQNNSSVR